MLSPLEYYHDPAYVEDASAPAELHPHDCMWSGECFTCRPTRHSLTSDPPQTIGGHSPGVSNVYATSSLCTMGYTTLQNSAVSVSHPALAMMPHLELNQQCSVIMSDQRTEFALDHGIHQQDSHHTQPKSDEMTSVHETIIKSEIEEDPDDSQDDEDEDDNDDDIANEEVDEGAYAEHVPRHNETFRPVVKTRAIETRQVVIQPARATQRANPGIPSNRQSNGRKSNGTRKSTKKSGSSSADNKKLRHREVEKNRHRQLQAMVRTLSDKIPGKVDKETQVQTMKRAARYCLYLRDVLACLPQGPTSSIEEKLDKIYTRSCDNVELIMARNESSM